MEIDSPNAIGVVSGFGVPTGGTSGQLLQKVNATNYNTQWVNSDNPTYIQALKSTTQTISTNLQTIVTGWTNTFTNNAGEWNSTTGVFTATKAGWYSVSGTVTYGSVQDTINCEYSVAINRNNATIASTRVFVELNQTAASYKHMPMVTAIVQLAIGDTMSVVTSHFAGANRALHTNGNSISIQELPGKILK